MTEGDNPDDVAAGAQDFGLLRHVRAPRDDQQHEADRAQHGKRRPVERGRALIAGDAGPEQPDHGQHGLHDRDHRKGSVVGRNHGR
jgi:hypothetical protein